MAHPGRKLHVTDFLGPRSSTEGRRRPIRHGVLAALLLTAPAIAAATDEELPTVEVIGARTAPPPAAPPVTTLTRDELDAGDVQGVRDLAARAPGLNVTVSGDRKSPFIGLRGLTNAFVGDTSVGLYVDGVPYADVRGPLVELYDVERVDILRGPQTTTFGRAADAGAISVVTPAPRNEAHGQASARYGNYDAQVYQASAGAALRNDTAFLDLAGIESRRDGYVRNIFLHEPLDDRDLAAGRVRLVVRPLPRLEMTLVGEGQHADDGPQVYVKLGQEDPFKVSYDTPGREITDAALGAVTARWDGPGVTLRSITARRWFDSHDNQLDFDFTPAPAAVLMDNYRFVDWTEELRVESPDPAARLRWRLGGFFEDRQVHPDVGIALGPGGSGGLNDAVSDQGYRTGAGFGRASFRIVPTIDVIGGLRVEDAHVTIDHRHVLRSPAGTAIPLAAPFSGRVETLAWLPHVGLEWRPEPLLRLWASAARSYRAGGWSQLSDDPTLARFGPQFGWTYDTGVERPWWQEQLVTSLDLFWIRERNYQDIQQVGLTSFTVRNAAQATSRGAEADMAVSPGAGFTFSLNAAWIDAHYDRYRDPTTHHRFDGNRLAFAPEYTYAVAGDWRHPRGAVAHVECQGVGAFPFLASNVVGQEPYALLNARVGWEWGRFGLYAYGRNLVDQTYFAFALPLGPGAGYATSPGDPRTFGMMATARF